MTSCINPTFSTTKMRPEVVTEFQYMDQNMLVYHSTVYSIISLHMCINYFVHVELQLGPLRMKFISFCSVLYIFYTSIAPSPKVFSKGLYFAFV